MRPLIAIVVAFVALLVALPWLRDMEAYSAPDDVPGHYEGAYADLPSGRTHYLREGRGPVVLLLAGLTGNYSVWDRVRPYLKKNFTVIAVDMYGRGYSERRPSYAYDRELYRRQLLELISALKITDAAVVGTSMGGAIAIDFAEHATAIVRRLVLIDSAGLPFDPPKIGNLAKLPFLGDYLLAIAMPNLLEDGYREGFYDLDKADARFRERYGRSAIIAGFRHAVIESIRRMPLTSLSTEVKRLAARRLPTLVIWGSEDHLVPLSVYQQFRLLLPESRGLIVHDAAHMPHAERPEIVGPNIAAFVQER